MALGAVPAVTLAYLSEEVSVRHVAAASASYIGGTTVGGLAGRLLSGQVGELVDWRAGMWATTAAAALATVLFLVLAPRARGFVPGRMRTETGPGVLARLVAPLRSGAQWALYAQGFLLMGAFVAVYNYLGFHLIRAPFLLPAWFVTLLFLAYLAGTFSSPQAGLIASRRGRYPVLMTSIAVTASGALLMLISSTPWVIAGLIIFTAGFFGAHAVASGWTSAAAPSGSRVQASSLYYRAYYGGSSLFGWALGLVFGDLGWACFLAIIVAMCLIAGAWARLALRGRPGAGAPAQLGDR